MVVSAPWTPEEDEILRALALSGASVAEMAKQMKRSEEAIRSRAYRLKIVVAKSRNKGLRLKAKGK
jgi:DNA-binding NarL/FixJ family response regulator